MDKEFLDVTADNLIIIRDARHALLSKTEPGEKTRIANAVFCRMLTICIVTSTEFILEAWRTKSQVLEPYFALPKNTPNPDRKRSLQKAFEEHWLDLEESVLDDYLAIKFMRNASVHLRWFSHEKDWVKLRNFPTDLTRFAMDDFDRMSKVYNKLAICIYQTEFDDPSIRAYAAVLARKLAE